MERSIRLPRHHKLADLLRRIRVAAGLTQVQVAERIGRHHPFVHDYEKGRRRLDVAVLHQIAHALGTTLTAIVKALDAPEDTDPVGFLDPTARDGSAPVASEGWYLTQRQRLIARLRELRRAAGLSETRLARILGSSQSLVAKYETGARRLDLIELEQITTALGTTLFAVITEFESAASSDIVTDHSLDAGVRTD